MVRHGMRSMRGALLFTIAMVAGAGCGKKADDAKPASATAPAPANDPTVVPESNVPLVPGTTASGIDISQLGNKLVEQKQHRGIGPSTDAVFAAVEKLGLKIETREQLLANNSGANYCEKILTGKIYVVVCEYGSEKDAIDGKARIDKAWSQLNSTLVRVVHNGTMLTVVHGGEKTPDVDRIITAFNAL